jgi:DNA polymerase III subunit gamma/tau
MSYQALARKWRPQTFRDILGQEAMVRTLQNAIEQDRVHHAYLFSGVRGVGKTTTARILAKALNCVTGPTIEPCNQCDPCREITEGIDLDVREIDAATYSKADDVRELREVMQFQPVRDRKRIFIIDEVHSLSQQAWNALLKQVEEPPAHVVFMMATTEMQKVPATILSRVQRLALNKITPAQISSRLGEICRAEGIEAEPAALEIIARRGEGSVRDSLSLLDQVIAFSGRRVGVTEVTSVLGISEVHLFAQLAEAIGEGRHAEILTLLEGAAEQGRDFKLLFRDFLQFLRNLLLIRGGAPEALLAASPDEIEICRSAAAGFEYSEILRILNMLLRDDDTIARSEQQRLAVEVSLLKAATLPRLRAVEHLLAGGTPPVPPTGPAAGTPATQRGSSSQQSPVIPPPSSARQGDSPASVEQFIERVSSQPQRRVIGSYLAQARASRIEGDQLIFEYEPDHIALGYIGEGDRMQFLEKIAGEVFGRKMRVRLVTDETAREKPAATQKSLLSEDPVIQGFARHLGGEVVTPKSKKRSEMP